MQSDDSEHQARRSLLVRAREGDPHAFMAAYDAYAEKVLAFAARRSYDPEAAMDVTSETFAVALEKLDQFRGSSASEELNWLLSIAHNELRHLWRSGATQRKYQRRLEIDVPQLDDEDFDRILGLAEIQDQLPALAAALEALPEDQRVAVGLRVVDEFDYAEMSAALGVSRDVARARVSRGLRTLAAMLRQDESVGATHE